MTKPDPMGWPPPESVVRAMHDRYLDEVVEGMNLCPFARRSREQGRVHRPILNVDADGPSPSRCAAVLHEIQASHADAEIVLMTFPSPDEHAFTRAETFEDFVRSVRAAYDELDGRVFYMVAFHPSPRVDTQRAITRDSLVPLIRRTPDPVIQCVDGRVLDDVRRQAQQVALRKMKEELGRLSPELAHILERSVAPDPELSSDIARANFESVGTGEGRERLDALIAEIRAARDGAYPDEA